MTMCTTATSIILTALAHLTMSLLCVFTVRGNCPPSFNTDSKVRT